MENKDIPDGPSGHTVPEQTEPYAYYPGYSNTGIWPDYRDIDTSHHTIYRHAHHAPEQLWPRDNETQ